MPLFEFVCNRCHAAFEDLVSRGETARCPECESEDVKKKLSVFAVAASESASPAPAAGPCGACGHPDGPGSCRRG